MATAHGWTGHSPRERYLYYPADKRVLRRCDRVVAVSEEIRSELIRHGCLPDRVVTVLNGIDERRFTRNPAARGPARAALGLGESDLAIGAVGRLERQKRFDLVDPGFRGSATRNSEPAPVDCRRRLAPQRPSGAHPQARSRRVVQIARHTPDVIALHHGLDLLVQSSDYEGTPNAVLEAMALETPVVATAAGGTAELMATASMERLFRLPTCRRFAMRSWPRCCGARRHRREQWPAAEDRGRAVVRRAQRQARGVPPGPCVR